MPRLRIHQMVHSEFHEAHVWYSDRSPLAALNFTRRFDAALARVATLPRSHAPWRAIFRRARLTPFPYLILFHSDRRLTPVLAVVHQRSKLENVAAAVKDRLARFT